MKYVFRLALFAAVLTLPFAVPASAQYMYMDSNGNGIHDSGDRLNANGDSTVVDIYLNTTLSRDGSAVSCNTAAGTAMDINSYAVNLVATGGTATYRNYINRQATAFPNQAQTLNAGDGTFKTGFFSFSYTPGGLFRIGSVTITGTGGSPKIGFVDLIAASQDITSFGTPCPGIAGDNTYRLDGPNTQAFYGGPGDWFDADGLDQAPGGNNPPLITNPGNKTTNELVNLAFTVTATDPDAGQTLTFSLDAGAPTGATISAGGAFSWTPSEAQGPGVHPVTVTATDNGTPAPQSASTGFSITVNEVNVAPVLAAIGNQTVTVNNPLSFTATATDADIPANGKAFGLTGAPAGATISAATGIFNWTPTTTGTFPVTVSVTDDGVPPLGDSEGITITVSPGANQPPVLAAIGNKSINELATLAFTATANDPDAGQTVAFTLDAGAPAGATIGSASGAFSWTPTEAQGPGSYPVTIRATDNATSPLGDFEAITIAVNEVNVAPVLASIGNKTATVGQLLTFTASATDADLPANTLTFSLDAGGPAGAAINATTGVFSFTPVSGQIGGNAVTVRVTDNGTPPLSDFEAITIQVDAAANVAPTLAAIGDKTVNENSILSFTATATDPDGSQTLTFSLDAGAPAGATINSTSGAFLWQPIESDGPGVFPITVRVTDNGTPALSDFELINVTVNEVNQAPVLNTIGDKTIDELVNLNFTATATDADLPANTLTFSLDAGAPSGAVMNTGGVFSWTPTEAQGPGSYPVTIRVTDNGTPALNDFSAISITVNEVNTAPVLAAIGDKATTVGVAATFTATATDADVPANTLAFSLDAGAPAGATIGATTGAFTYTPSANGTFPVTVRVTDNGTPALSDFEVISIVVSAAPNEAPVLGAIGNKTINENNILAFTATATDADAGQTLTFSLDAGAPAGAAINGATGAFSWQTGEADGGNTFPITIRVTDDGTPPLSDSELITVTVVDSNQAPIVDAIADKTVNELATLSFTATAIDEDIPADILTFSLDAGAPAGATISAGGAFSWTPTEAQGPGSYPVTVRATDNGVAPLSRTASFTITVNEVNEAPILAAIGDKATTIGVAVAFTATATDGDIPANSLAFSLDAGAPAGATISASTGAFSYTPSADGTFPVTVRVTDDGTPALSDFEAISIVVSAAPNQAPTLAAIGNKTVNEEANLNFTATATDPDAGQTLLFSLDAGSPAGAGIDGPSGAFSWTPTETQGPGSYPITLRVTDDGTPNLSDSELITVTVNEVNVAPVLAAIGNKAGTVGVEVAFTASATDADIPANALTFSLDAGAPAGATINSTTGAFSWTPSATGSFAATVRVTDDGTPALDDFEAISINVTEAVVNHAPVLDAIGNKTVDEEALLSFTATATDPDAGQTLAFSLDAGAPSGAAITAGGVFSWTPAEVDGPGTFPVTVRVTDNGTPAMDDFEAITITVNEVNVAPVLAAIGNKGGVAGAQIAFKATVTDADIPTNEMTFSLDAGAPAGAAIDPTTGDFTWTPSGAGAFTVVVRVTDNGIPALDDFEEITINVTEEVVNHPPVLAAIGNKTVDEETLLSFTATATDPDAGQTLAFSLDAGAPSGAAITTGGVFSWTPAEVDGPGSFPVTVRVTDNGTPAMDDFEAITITVNEVNVAPVLAAIGNKGGVAGAQIAFKATVTDADIPTNEMTFSLDAGAPAGAAIDPTTGNFTWTPSTGGAFNVVVRVTDNGIPALSDFEEITINVTEEVVNHPPVLNAIGNKTVDEQTLLSFTTTATDPDAGQTLTFSLDAGAPSGAAITAGGVFSWTPTETQGPGSFPVTIRVTDNGTPVLDDFEAITITVNEVNVAPVLAAIGNKTGTVGALIAFTASATDADIPVNTLTFSLDAGAPAGATIGASSGVFNWTPAGSGNFSATVRVTDNGIPALSDFETIQITVSAAQNVAAHAFFFGINVLTILESRDPFTCVQIEPVKNSYSNSNVDLSSIVMMYAGKQITANAELDGDRNHNRVSEIKACFSKSDLRYLFSGLSRGLHRVEVSIEGNLTSGARFHDTVTHFVLVIGNRCDLAARPNPLNPETVLNFTTTQRGPVTVRVFDISGRLVKTLQDGTMPAGFNSIRWDGSAENGTRVATGVYFVKMISLDGEQKLRLTVLK